MFYNIWNRGILRWIYKFQKMWMWNEMSLKFIIEFYLVKHYIIRNYAIHESMKRQICVLHYIETIFPLKSDFRPQVGYRVPKNINIVFIFFFF